MEGGFKRKGKYKIQLAAYNASDEVFSKIKGFVPAKCLKFVSNNELRLYEYGAPSKRCVYYNGSDTMIVPDWVLDHVLGGRGQKEFPYTRMTHQVILYLKHNAAKRVEHTYTGMRADRAMRRLLKEAGYSAEGIDERLRAFEAEYDPHRKQIHFLKPDSRHCGKICRYENCAEFDINSAYCSVLIEIFPNAKELLKKAYEERKIHPENKAMFNYFVGMLCNKGRRKTYNYIVQRTTQKLSEFIDSHGGMDNVIYANTDGVVMKVLSQYSYDVSKELGAFKLEASGDCYVYQCDQYWAMQLGDKLVGSILWDAKKRCDLSKNVVVSYDRIVCSKQSDMHVSQKVSWLESRNVRQRFPGIISDRPKPAPKPKRGRVLLQLINIKRDKEERANEKNNENLQDKIRQGRHKNLLLLQEIRI